MPGTAWRPGGPAKPFRRCSLAITKVFDVAEDWLNALIARLAAEGIDIPERHYVAEGSVAWDACEQLAVEHLGIFRGLPGAEDSVFSRCATPRFARYQAWLLRCAAEIPDGSEHPTDEALHASAQEVLTDAYALMKTTVEAAVAGELAEVPCDAIIVGTVQPRGPEGGIVGNTLAIEVQV